jgi:pyruvate formate lyase activating enzyme
MIIKGFAKLTLLDYPGRVACTVFTGGCNFRCPFCHNASLAIRAGEVDTIPESEVFELLKKRKGILDGVCITGGEPLLFGDELYDFIVEIKKLGYAVKLDTNGSFPKRLASLIEAGLVDKVAMDIKNSPDKYALTAGVEGFDISPILESIELLKSSGVDYEFRTTVVKELHSPSDFEEIGKMIDGAKAYFLQSFVDSGDLIGEGLSAPSKEEMEEYKKIASRYVPNARIRGE